MIFKDFPGSLHIRPYYKKKLSKRFGNSFFAGCSHWTFSFPLLQPGIDVALFQLQNHHTELVMSYD